MSKERLTYVDENGEVLFHPEDFPEDEGLTITQLADDKRYKALEEIAGRLANREQYCELLEKELKQYRDSEEQGLFLRLPCKVGDTVWAIATDRHTKEKLVEETTIRKILVDAEGILLSCDINPISRNIFGETVFSTRSEAERKLKKISGFER